MKRRRLRGLLYQVLPGNYVGQRTCLDLPRLTQSWRERTYRVIRLVPFLRLQDKNVQIRRWRVIRLGHPEFGRADLFHAFTAETQQVRRRAFIDGQREGAYRLRPIGSRGQHVGDPLLREGVVLSTSRCDEAGVSAVPCFVVGQRFRIDRRQADRRGHRAANARGVLVFDV